MSVYGYIRVSSKNQKEDRQQIALKEVGVELRNIYIDKQSGKDFNRPQYKKMLRKLKKDGVFLCISRKARLCYRRFPVGLCRSFIRMEGLCRRGRVRR